MKTLLITLTLVVSLCGNVFGWEHNIGYLGDVRFHSCVSSDTPLKFKGKERFIEMCISQTALGVTIYLKKLDTLIKKETLISLAIFDTGKVFSPLWSLSPPFNGFKCIGASRKDDSTDLSASPFYKAILNSEKVKMLFYFEGKKHHEVSFSYEKLENSIEDFFFD